WLLSEDLRGGCPRGRARLGPCLRRTRTTNEGRARFSPTAVCPPLHVGGRQTVRGDEGKECRSHDSGICWPPPSPAPARRPACCGCGDAGRWCGTSVPRWCPCVGDGLARLRRGREHRPLLQAGDRGSGEGPPGHQGEDSRLSDL